MWTNWTNWTSVEIIGLFGACHVDHQLDHVDHSFNRIRHRNGSLYVRVRRGERRPRGSNLEQKFGIDSVTSTMKTRRDLLGDETAPVELQQIVSAPQLATLLGISPRMVTEHAKVGIVVRLEPGQYDLKKSVRGFCDHLRDKAQSDELTQERIRQTREAADSLALKNAKAKSELLPAAEVEQEWAGILRDVRAGCLAITARVQQQLPHLTAHDAAMIDSEIRAALGRLGDSDA